MLALAGAIVLLLMVLGLAEVTARSVFNRPMIGYIDVVGLLTSAVAFLAISHCQGAGKHIRMELLVSSLRGRAHWLAELVGTLVALLVVTLLLTPTWQHASRSMLLGDSTMDLNLPMWPSKVLVPLALGVLWMRLALNALGYLRLVIRPDAEPVAVPRPDHDIVGDADIEERRA
jgi:C4-dicarboxylate transporter DctQ subunit